MFPTLAANYFIAQAWHIRQPPKAYKWFLHGDEILHCCHSENECFEKNVLRSVNTSLTGTSFSLLLEFGHFSACQCRRT